MPSSVGTRRPVAVLTRISRWTSQAVMGETLGMNHPVEACGQEGVRRWPETEQSSTFWRLALMGGWRGEG